LKPKNNFSDPVIPTCQYVVSTLYLRVVAKSKNDSNFLVQNSIGLWMALSILKPRMKLTLALKVQPSFDLVKPGIEGGICGQNYPTETPRHHWL